MPELVAPGGVEWTWMSPLYKAVIFLEICPPDVHVQVFLIGFRFWSIARVPSVTNVSDEKFENYGEYFGLAYERRGKAW